MSKSNRSTATTIPMTFSTAGMFVSGELGEKIYTLRFEPKTKSYHYVR